MAYTGASTPSTVHPHQSQTGADKGNNARVTAVGCGQHKYKYSTVDGARRSVAPLVE